MRDFKETDLLPQSGMAEFTTLYNKLTCDFTKQLNKAGYAVAYMKFEHGRVFAIPKAE